MKIMINVGLQKSNEKNVGKGEKMSTLDEILKEINKAKSIVILTHKNAFYLSAFSLFFT